MKNILILGGTRFVGKKLLKLLYNDKTLKSYVASRREVETENFFLIDRKNEKDLEALFEKQQFDLIVDFINFSAPDSQKLISAIKKSEQQPHIIMVSSVYAYTKPDELLEDKVYSEEDFKPENYEFSMQDTPDVGYTEGKRSMEAYLMQNYPSENITIIRFPVILGEDDYTKRAHFFWHIIKENKKIALHGKGKKANYILSNEAAEAILFFIQSSRPGIFNIVLEPAVNELEIMDIYCNFFGKQTDNYLDDQSKKMTSPFFYDKHFITDGSKFRQLYSIDISFPEALLRELKKMEK